MTDRELRGCVAVRHGLQQFNLWRISRAEGPDREPDPRSGTVAWVRPSRRQEALLDKIGLRDNGRPPKPAVRGPEAACRHRAWLAMRPEVLLFDERPAR